MECYDLPRWLSIALMLYNDRQEGRKHVDQHEIGLASVIYLMIKTRICCIPLNEVSAEGQKTLWRGLGDVPHLYFYSCQIVLAGTTYWSSEGISMPLAKGEVNAPPTEWGFAVSLSDPRALVNPSACPDGVDYLCPYRLPGGDER